MRVRRRLFWIKTDARGRYTLPPDLEDFIRQHPDRALKIRVEVQSKEPSERLTNFFFGVVVKEMQVAFHQNGEDYTEAKTYDTIRRNCPLFLEESRVDGCYKARLKEFEELDVAEAVEIIAWVQRWAAENYYYQIPDPE